MRGGATAHTAAAARLEEIVGTQLLQRRREGLQLTNAGIVLPDVLATEAASALRWAAAALVWNGDLPRPLQQVLFDASDGIARPDPAWASGTDAKVR